MLIDDLKVIKDLADEAFAEVEDSAYPEEVKASLLGHLDDISISVEAALDLLS